MVYHGVSVVILLVKLQRKSITVETPLKAAQMTDPGLRSFVEGLAAGHDEIYGRIRGLLQ